MNRIVRIAGLSIVLPLLAIQVLLRNGASPITALLVAAIFPLVEMVLEALESKRVGIITIVSLAGIVAGFGLSFATGNAIFALLKDSVFTCAFGLVFLGTLFTGKPLIYRLSLEFAGADAAARARSEALWEVPAARRVFRLLTVVWGVGLLFEAAARVVAAMTLPLAAATSASPIITAVVIGGLTLFTVVYVRARRRAATRAAAAASVG